MTILHIDDFEVYDTVRGSGAMGLTWLERMYIVRQSSTSNLRIQNSTANDPYTRVVLANGAQFTGNRSIYLPLGSYLFDHNRITIGQKLVDFTTYSSAAIGGVSQVTGGSESHIIAFGFHGSRDGFVKYVNASGEVVEDLFRLSTSLSGRFDTIEWTFEKEVNDRNEYRNFSLWVNNRPAYVGPVMCQVGSAGVLAARILGGIATPAAGSTSSTGYLPAAGNTIVPAYGTTDIVVTDGVRQGRVRVISRRPSGDIGPNTMTPSMATEDHADLVNSTPPNEANYLTASSAAAEERFWSQAYTDLSSENVLAIAVRVAGQKNSPEALDMVPTFSNGANVYGSETVPTDLSPAFGAIILDKNPWTNLNWTPLEANSLQFGVKVA